MQSDHRRILSEQERGLVVKNIKRRKGAIRARFCRRLERLLAQGLTALKQQSREAAQERDRSPQAPLPGAPVDNPNDVVRQELHHRRGEIFHLAPLSSGNAPAQLTLSRQESGAHLRPSHNSQRRQAAGLILKTNQFPWSSREIGKRSAVHNLDAQLINLALLQAPEPGRETAKFLFPGKLIQDEGPGLPDLAGGSEKPGELGEAISYSSTL